MHVSQHSLCFLKEKITVKERIVIQEAYNMNSLGGLVGMVRRILFGTVVVEGIGAVFMQYNSVGIMDL